MLLTNNEKLVKYNTEDYILKYKGEKKMNRKNLLLSIVALIVIMIVSLLPTTVNAQVANTSLYLGITELRTNDSPNMGYAIGDPNDNGSGTNATAAKLWNIRELESAEQNAPAKTDGNKNIYCIKAGVGFSDEHKSATYNIFYDMKTERTTIPETVINYKNAEITVDEVTVNRYDALLALADMLYLIDGEDNQEERLAYLEANGASNGYPDYADVILTRDDIAAVQQAAIWFFTNSEEGTKFDKREDTTWLNYTLDGNDYEPLTDYPQGEVEGIKDEGYQRNEQANLLYNNLIKKAVQNANNYSGSTSNTGLPVKLNTQTLNYEKSNGSYILGPINIAEVSNLPYNINLKIENGSTTINDYKLLNADKQEVAEGTTINDLVGSDFYISVDVDNVETIKLTFGVDYSYNKLTLWTTETAKEQPVMIPEKIEDSENLILEVTPDNEPFDLALRKYITQVNGVNVTNSRVPEIDEGSLQTGTTATYKHRKDPVLVETGSIVTYNITIYNEGEKDGRATKIVDQLPTGLKFNKVVSGNFELESYNESGDNKLTLVRKSGNEDNLPAYTGTGDISSETITIECEVTATPDETETKILTNIAYIAEEYNAEDNVTITNQDGADRDSTPETAPNLNKDNMEDYTGNEENKENLADSDYYYKGQEDDDDFEKLVLMPESFDLKLIKRITAVNDRVVEPDRLKGVDVSDLNTIGEDGNLVTTADYDMDKTPVSVKKGDIVTYTFRIYNEGTIDGYASEITEDVPEGLEFVWSELEGEDLDNDPNLTDDEKEAVKFNQQYLWGNFQYDENREKIVQISTDYLSKEVSDENLIPAFGDNDGTKTEADLHYKEVSVKFKVVSEDVTGTTIRNEAAITEDTDENGDPVDDRDSNTDDWVKYEDDEDFDNVILQSFDLALRKFIIAVSDNETIDDEEYLKNADGSYTRAPVVDTSLLNTTDAEGNLITTAIYNHTKEPVLVQLDDYVVYMLRVYNEGEIAGYAAEIKDHLPPYLEFVDNEFNKEYGWEVSEDGRTITTRYLEDSLIEAASKNEEGGYVLSYVDVPIMCKVTNNAPTSENITNIADITEYQDENKEPVRDRDSNEDNVNLPSDEELPNYKDDVTGEYIPGQEDDDDFEKVVIKIFDLSLRKWVTQAIVIDKDGQTITETGHQPYDDPEEIVKVELHRKHINDVTVKFRYKIRVTNEGEIAGYAKEVTDYIPEGLRFIAEDNPGWTDEGNNVISTRLLENTLLQPGEYAEVEVVLTWINDENNMGLKVNTAEISEDYNDYDVPDIDSTPDNQKEGEDDIDDAPVMLSVGTGTARTYFTLGLVVLVTIAGGIFVIKKYVL